MYNTLANGGFRTPLRAVRAVVDEAGQAAQGAGARGRRRRRSPRRCTARSHAVAGDGARHRQAAQASSCPPELVVAGKTGTSYDYRDSWFAGFSGSHLIVRGSATTTIGPTGLTGSTGALAVWSRLMGSIDTSSFEPLMPEPSSSAGSTTSRATRPRHIAAVRRVSMSFATGTPLVPSEACPPGSDSRASDEAGLGVLDELGGAGNPVDVAPVEAEPEVP